MVKLAAEPRGSATLVTHYRRHSTVVRHAVSALARPLKRSQRFAVNLNVRSGPAMVRDRLEKTL